MREAANGSGIATCNSGLGGKTIATIVATSLCLSKGRRAVKPFRVTILRNNKLLHNHNHLHLLAIVQNTRKDSIGRRISGFYIEIADRRVHQTRLKETGELISTILVNSSF